jgi:hypothetical protein
MYYRRRQVKNDYGSIDDMNKESEVEESSSDNDSDYDSDNDSDYDSDYDSDCKYETNKHIIKTNTEGSEGSEVRILNNIVFNEEGVFITLFIIGFVLLSFNFLFT